jgi:hypothetical protein
MAFRNCGGLWLKEGAKGKFFSGEFQPDGKDGKSWRIMVFKNDKKEGRQPDYRIVLADDDKGDKHHFRATDADGSEPF